MWSVLGCFALWALMSAAVTAAPVVCPEDARIRVDAGPEIPAEAVYGIVSRAREHLGACHLVQSRPLTIRVVAYLSHPFAACMAIYDCRDDAISVTAPARLAAKLPDDSIWRRIRMEALFESLIVHELAHAFLDQTECKRIPCYADHEYIAYAMQIDALAPADREAVLEGHRVRLPVDPAALNEFTAQAAPGHFAQSVWLHFNTEGNGCAFVGKLVRGETTLWQDPL